MLDQRLIFLARYLAGEDALTALCAEFAISRPTAYKWIARYQQDGPAGLQDRSRAPLTHPQAVDAAILATVLAVKQAHPTWGPRKLRDHLRSTQPTVRWPAASTLGSLLADAGLVRHRRTRRPPTASPSSPLTPPLAPNHVWSIDFKGWFRLGDGTCCYPLTLTDQHSRFLLCCHALAGMTTAVVRPVLEQVFRTYGLPTVIRSDNGAPFASHGLGGLTPLAIWWLHLGIRPERIRPGCPAQNGRHERFHRTLNEDTLQPPAPQLRAQQRSFRHYQQVYNTERPHAALDGQCPATLFTPSPRRYPSRPLPAFQYAAEVTSRRMGANGVLHYGGREIYASESLAGEVVGLKPLGDRYHLLLLGPVTLAMLETTQWAWLPRAEANRLLYLYGEENLY